MENKKRLDSLTADSIQEGRRLPSYSLAPEPPLMRGEGVGCAFGALDCFPTIHIGGALDGNLQLAETGECMLIYPVPVG
ncbi:hypothetical protein SULPSESMR1_03114 [Pseudosulfitobacter pseudonitzschiae]|uniref:Uncharacterized protein n=1 Tax=Pseudosulfitobacter pseudonitzschiae TaxID=1402135 RepID=A0A221K4G6_9RHOB|nr:hypothetical protein SULPSESMR1_03114 [Pseudosulfitobacter pseudonitzschiae]